MQKILTCRRTGIAALAIVLLFVLGYDKDQDVAMAIAGIAGALAGANAFEGSKTKAKVVVKKDDEPPVEPDQG